MRKIKVLIKSIKLFKNWWMIILARIGIRKKEFILRFRDGLSMIIPAPVNCIMGVYEVFGDEVYFKYSKNPKTAVDIGGGIGDFALYCARRGGEVFMYEMDENRSKTAQKNISINGVKGIRIYTEKVEALPPINCDLLKLDCEGAEYEIFQNSPDKSFDGINNIAMEYHKTSDPLRNRLVSLGYKVRVEPFPALGGYMYATKTGEF